MGKKVRRSVAAGLGLSLLLQMALAGVWAQPAVPDGGTAGAAPAADALSSARKDIVEEVVSLRGEYEKHFLCEDGTYLVATYPEPVHYAQDGEWVEIDNTLQPAPGSSAAYAVVENRDGLFDIAFSENPADPLVTMQSEGYTLSWDVDAAQPQAAVFAAAPADEARTLTVLEAPDASAVELPETVADTTAAVQIDTALPEVSLQYTVLPRGVKEDILLHSRSAPASYTVTFRTQGLAAQLQEDDTVVFRDAAGETVFTVAAPYLYDSADEFCTLVTQTLTQTADGYVLTLTPDAAWLQDPARVYPVTLDPSVTANTGSSNVLDTYTFEGDTAVHNNETYLYFGNRSVNGTRKEHRVYSKVKQLPSISAGSYVDSATYTFYLTSTTSTAHPINAYPVTSSWTSGAINWSTKPSYYDSSSYNIAENLSPVWQNGKPVRYELDLTASLRRVQSGSYTNNGLMFRYVSNTVQDHNRVFSSESSNRPLLTIRYSADTNIANGTYVLRNVASQNFLDAVNFGGSGTETAMYDLTGNTNQQWQITKISGGYYTLRPRYNTNLALSVQAGSDGTRVKVVDISGQSAVPTSAKWKIVKNEDGIRIASAYTGCARVLDCPGGNTTPGTYVQIWEYFNNGNKNQAWEFIQSEMVLDIPLIGQKRTMWCWAACVEMIVNLYFPNTQITQEEIVEYVFGSVKNNGVTENQLKDALIHFTGYSFVLSDEYSNEWFFECLIAGNPIGIGQGTGKELHTFLICGYELSDYGCRWIVYDPSPMGNGSQKMLTYDQIVYGDHDTPVIVYTYARS